MNRHVMCVELVTDKLRKCTPWLSPGDRWAIVEHLGDTADSLRIWFAYPDLSKTAKPGRTVMDVCASLAVGVHADVIPGVTRW